MGGIPHPAAARAIRSAVLRISISREMAPGAIAFAVWFGLRRREANTLAALYEAGGKALQTKDLARRLGLSVAALYGAVSHIRDAMETEAVDCDNGHYWLTEIGMAECIKALDDAMENLTRAVRRPDPQLSSRRSDAA